MGFWESALFASFYRLDNLIAIIDVNRLGQTSSTMNGAIFKNGSILKTITYGFKRDDDSAVISGVYLDSPATTSSIAYQLYFSMSTGTAFINASNTLGTITAMEIAA